MMYEIAENVNENFILKLTPVAERMYFIKNRIVPLLLFMSAVFVFQQLFNKMPMGWVYMICLGLVTIALYKLLQKNTGAIIITPTSVKLKEQRLFGHKETNISSHEIKNIHLYYPGSDSDKHIFILNTVRNIKIILVTTTDSDTAQKCVEALQKFMPGKLILN